MSTGTTASLWFTLLSVVLSVSGEQRIIRAEPGQTVSLPCEALNNGPVLAVDWSRADLKEDEYVLFYRDKKLDPAHQHPSYKNRADLQDRTMKDGDASLILNNVTTDDNATYTCRILTKTNRWKRAILDSDPISIIRLDVFPPGHTSGHKEDGGDKEGGDKEGGDKEGPVGLIVGLIAGAAVVVAVVGFLIFRRRRHPGPYHPPDPQQLYMSGI